MNMNFSVIQARISEADAAERRQFDRLPIELGATMRQLGETGTEARIVNISERGFMAQSEGKFEVGARVWLMLPGRARANAIVRWTAGDKLGAEFAQPISLHGLGVSGG
jgi:hypothetical protein